MALTPSNMLPLGTKAPDFSLPHTHGGRVAFDETSRGSAFLVMFICNHCPYVKHLAPALASLGKEYAHRGVSIFAINSNDVENYPDDSPEKMVFEKKSRGYVFPYLFDEDQ